MKQHKFSIFIILLGCFTAYVFYIFWHNEEINPPKMLEEKPEKIVQDLTNKKTIPKKNQFNRPVLSQSIKNIPVENKMLDGTNESIVTQEQLQEQTEEVYESLVPDNYEESMEEAAMAFERLDVDLEVIDEKLADEMAAVEEIKEDNMKETEDVEEDSEHDSMPIPEDHENSNQL